jgi:hypothetical protein
MHALAVSPSQIQHLQPLAAAAFLPTTPLLTPTHNPLLSIRPSSEHPTCLTTSLAAHLLQVAARRS